MTRQQHKSGVASDMPAGGAGLAGSRCSELRLMIGLAAPSAIISCLRMGQMLTDQAVIGHLSFEGRSTPVYLDAAALALLWMTLTLSAVNRGLNATVNMLVSQSLGAGNKALADTWLLTGMLIAVPGAVVVSGLWLCTAPVVSLFAHNQTVSFVSPTNGSTSFHLGESHAQLALTESFMPAVAMARASDGGASDGGAGDGVGDPVALAGLYARLSIGYILPTLWMEAVSNWLIAHRIIRPQLVVYSLCLLLNLGLNVLFVHGVRGFGGFGFHGSPLATTTTRIVQLVAMLLALPLSGIKLPRPTFSDAVRPARLRVFVAQFGPRSLSTLLEEIALQTIGALAGRLGAVETATHNAMLMTFFWLTSPMYGVGTATQQRMGYHLGAGNPRAARRTAWMCLAIMMSIGLAVAATMVAVRNEAGHIFSNDARVIAMVAAITPLVASAYCIVGVFYASMAILGGQGRPLPVALAFFLGAFLIAPTSGYLLTFVVHCCGAVLLYGLWFGLIAGYTITTLISSAAVLISDWPLIAKQAQERSEALPRPSHRPVYCESGGDVPPAGPPNPADAACCDPNRPSRGPPSRCGASSHMEAPLLQNAAPVPPVPTQPVSMPEAETWAEAD